ncbi:6-carboxytetrahydropterin synthase [Acanthopleuribacter pedis]|uniref:6-carboxy-5,6,7,8-tetrahydropterin synthase n=1 Tax=Acanthopleuribacter pedis TaxID=442870 RepID=A0A8J7Q5N6_9BACT|nr:6-carboxytetrahydropterin synthase [Acanthopleuribacter pedis]
MPKIVFARKVSFHALHHYALPQLSAAQNRAYFGDAAEPHRHLWSVTVWLSGPPAPETGMVVDLPAVDAVLKEQVVARFDGRHINEVDPFFARCQPSTETLADYFAARLAPLLAPAVLEKLRVAEADDLFAEWWR